MWSCIADGAAHVLPNEGDVRRSGNLYSVRDMNGNSVQVTDQPAATHYLDVVVGLGHWPNNVQGLLASAKDNVSAVVARTGTVFPAPFNARRHSRRTELTGPLIRDPRLSARYPPASC